MRTELWDEVAREVSGIAARTLRRMGFCALVTEAETAWVCAAFEWGPGKATVLWPHGATGAASAVYRKGPGEAE